MTNTGQPKPVVSDPTAQLRRAVYGILIAVAVGNMAGRILAVNSVDVTRLETYRINQRLNETKLKLIAGGIAGAELKQRLADRKLELEEKLALQRPFLSANDRSRWLTVRSLVELGTYEVDELFRLPRWDSIDMVSHKGKDGKQHYYSSKPPILATLIAGEYWLVHKATGKTLGTHPHELGRFMLLTINVPLFLLMYIMLARLVEYFGRTGFGRIFVMATATLGTLLTSFAVVLNNHVFGAASVAVALYYTVRIVDPCSSWKVPPRPWHFILAGFAGAFAVACELPALSFFAILAVVLLWRAPRGTLLWFTPAALVVVAAFFGTNYAAHNTFSPPYAHRHAENPEDDWYDFTYEKNGKTVQSYFSNPGGLDKGEPDKGVYALHVLVGHHGIFSLTPVWLLSVFGAGAWLLSSGRCRRVSPIPTQQQKSDGKEETPSQHESGIRAKQLVAFATVLLTAVCLVFFIYLRPQGDRNYGGSTNGFRWVFWLIPLWLIVMLPAAEWVGRRCWTRCLAYILLASSVLSVAYATWTPWSHPWIMRWMESMGWM